MGLLSPVEAQADPAPIHAVIVYADRAQITRRLTADCAAGEVRFSDLPSTLQPETLWAGVVGGGEGAVVGLTYTVVAGGPRSEADTIQQQIRDIDVKLTAENGEDQAARDLLAKIKNYEQILRRVWGRQAAEVKPDVTAWDRSLDLLFSQAGAANLRRRQIRSRVRDLQRKRSLLVQELAQIERKRRRTTIEATAVLSCQGRRTVDLTYMVPGASFQLSYQLRADLDGRKAEVVAQATVAQGTGEDWTQVELALSTANLMRRNTPPSIEPLRISTQKPDTMKKVLTRRFEERKHLSTTPASVAKEQGARPTGEPAAKAMDLAMSLPAQGRSTIPGDGRQVMVTLARAKASAKIEYETVPKLFPFVYTRISTKNPLSFPMLEGLAELYNGRSYMGRTVVKPLAPGEPLAFTLGVHNQLQVERYVKLEKLEKAGAFGPKQRLRHRYMIQVGNWTSEQRVIRVLENIPVSRLKEVEVILEKDTSSPSTWDRTDGILGWEVVLPGRSKKSLTLDYTVSVPKEYEVQGYN